MTKEIYDPIITFWAGGHYSNGKRKLPTAFENRGANNTFDVIQQIPFSKIIPHILSLTPNGEKGDKGFLHFWLDDSTVYHTKDDQVRRGTYRCAGICGSDFDHLPNEYAIAILKDFWKYVEKMPQLMHVSLSNSKRGVHVVYRCKAGLDEFDYLIEDIKQTARFIEVVKEVSDLDIEKYTDENGVEMSLRYFFAPSEAPWNKYAEEVNITTPEQCPVNTEEVKKKWIKGIKRLSDDKESIETEEPLMGLIENTDYTTQYSISGKLNKDSTVYVHNNQRWALWWALYDMLDHDEEKFRKHIEAIAQILEKNNPDHDHNASYYVNEAVKTIKKSKRADYIPHAVLYKLGYTTKNRTIEKKEKEIQEEKSKSEDKRKKLVEIRKGWISKITPNENKIKLEGRYIGDKEKKIIEDTITENKYTTLKAGTGTGKTTTIKKIAAERKGIIAAPFLVLRDEYLKDSKLTMIKTKDEYKGTTGCCMTYDRLATLDSASLTNKWIFIDEVHILFMDRSYRPALVTLYNKIKELVENYGCHVCMVSATPIITAGTKLLEFYQDRPFVNVYPVGVQCKDGKHGKRTEAFIKKRILETGGIDDRYDRVIIFSDQFSRRLFDSTTFILGDSIGIMHSDYPEESKKITCDNLLKAKKTVCTSIAYNGLNFNNKDEYIAVIAVVDDTTTAWNIIQQCGRVRNSIVDLYIVWNDSTETSKLTVDQKVELNRLRTELNLTSKELWDKQIEADKEIEEYVKKNNDIFTILFDLIDEEYFIVNAQRYIELDDAPKTNPLRKAADEFIKKNFSENLFDPSYCPTAEKKIMEKYFKDSIKSLRYIYEGAYNIDIMEMKRVFDSASKKSIQSIVADLKHIKQAIEYTDEDLKSMEDKFKGMSAASSDKVLMKQIRSQLNEIENLHATYSDCDSDLSIIDKYCLIQDEKTKKEKLKKGEGGKNGIHIKVTFKNETKLFNTKKEAAEWIGCTQKLINNIISKKSPLSKKCQIEVV